MSTTFTRKMTSGGPAEGMTLSGRMNASVQHTGDRDVPLVVALHGGGYDSKFFDVPGYSLLDRAEALGIPAIAVDRPNYGGTSRLETDGSIFQANVETIDHFIGELWEEFGGGTTGVFLVGHSIGGALSILLASNTPAWPLLGVALSGCLVQSPPDTAARFTSLPMEWLPCDGAMRFQLMFGPAGSYSNDMPAAEEAVHGDTPVLVKELVEIFTAWEDRFRELAPSITVPVHLRHGEFDHLWISDRSQVKEFVRVLVNSPLVDAELWPGVGHDIDYHRAGPAFQTQQLAFALTAATRLIGGPEAS
ncbi:alpha/beta hydrolase [Pseudonocardia sp. NPDC049635]|uniref:alpha/beta hydrolase n=1 Tax=Pseudonocardia sp. NPDC049635 TaxID=3155506 RepID=UPI003403F605